MSRLLKNMALKAGQSPGSLAYVGDVRMGKVEITLFDYAESDYKEERLDSIEKALDYAQSPERVTWINIDGLHDVEVIKKIGERLNIHPLVLEDIANTGQRPKQEFFEHYLFMAVKMLTFNEKVARIKVENVSFILTAHCLITFQERPGDVFQIIRERIRHNKGRIRKNGTDYLAYALLDAIVDHYFVILEKLGDHVDMESVEEVDGAMNPSLSTTLHKAKHELLFLKRSVWPLRDLVNGIRQEESSLIQSSTEPYIRDLYDHTIQVVDTTETFRDMISGILDTYLTTVGNRMNETMQNLTIIATIFIPLTFIAGVYGMNFKYMPELDWRWGYLYVLLLMAIVAVITALFFKRKRWL